MTQKEFRDTIRGCKALLENLTKEVGELGALYRNFQNKEIEIKFINKKIELKKTLKSVFGIIEEYYNLNDIEIR